MVNPGIARWSTEQARLAVKQINSETKVALGHWGRQGGKWLNWTLVGTYFGIRIMCKRSKAVRNRMQQEHETLLDLRNLLRSIPRAQRSPAQRRLLRKTHTALRKFRPTLRTHVMEGLKGLAIFATVAAVLAAEVAVVVGIATSKSTCNYAPGAMFVYCYGFGPPYVYVPAPRFSDSYRPLEVTPREGDAHNVGAPYVKASRQSRPTV